LVTRPVDQQGLGGVDPPNHYILGVIVLAISTKGKMYNWTSLQLERSKEERKLGAEGRDTSKDILRVSIVSGNKTINSVRR